MKSCVVCGKAGERHHIVFKNSGGFDFPLNFIYLCSEHHRGKNGPHKNRIVDLNYKISMQNELFNRLSEEYYAINDIVKILEINPRQAKVLVNDLAKYNKGYKTEDVIKKLMGGKFYYGFMIDENYKEWWNIPEEEIFLNK
ncbi:HNH endonuclease signature motif containing protein [Haloimpatiens lingqiaonensis]|uniref:HNH endonuclease signature motif containing protein n=1 Tax=Haloimpatiens lingqiaonensis TaxID=1380675 RepID=UPI001FA9EA4D|nr:HNH endonuclease signature motif containing protein [Haloimpatiens lingqiaonensis]